MNNDLHELLITYVNILIERGLTPYTIAKASGINAGTLSKFLSRKHSPNLRICNRIIERLDLKLELFDRQGGRIYAHRRAGEPAVQISDAEISDVGEEAKSQ